jgi:carboxyl-terminal processing protease
MNLLRRNKRLAIFSITAITIGLLSFGPADNYFEISKNIEIFTSLYRELNVYYVDETRPGDLMKKGIDAMLTSLDPYTIYYPESKIEDYQFMTTGQYGGIGALIQTIDEEIVITEPYEGFAAAKGGLRAGDVILAVDGKSIAGKSQDEISDILKGQAGTSVNIRFRRPGIDLPQEVELKREDIKIPDVPFYDMINSSTGYIRLTGFTQTASNEVRSAFKELKDKRGMQQLILDLRGNGGGLLKEAVNIVNFFVPKGTEIVSTKGKIEEWNRSHSALNEPLDVSIPLVVLVDGMSASASEIVAGALQDLDRAVVIGAETFGKGLVQQTKDLSYNTKLKLTVAKYYIPSGRCIQRLDYSHKDDSGKASSVPDSLIKPFKTARGRPVFDGRGISPDVTVDAQTISHILNGLLSNNIIFKFATEFRNSADSLNNSPETFSLSDKDYEAFKNMALKDDFKYNTDTELAFEDLKAIAAEEKYLTGAEGDFDALFAKIQPNKETDLEKFKTEIKEFIENEIVSRYYYQSGRIRYDLKHDPVVDRSLKVLSGDYNDILGLR